jgi:hypothetical protein
MSNGVGVGTLTIKTKYDTNFFDITLKKIDSDFSNNPISKSLEIVDNKTYKYTIDDLSDNSIHYYKLSINYINSSVTPSPNKKFHHITLRRDSTLPSFSGLTIASNNSTNTLAKANDEVTLTITTNEAISTPSVTFTSGSASINDSSITYAGSGTSWTAKYTVNSNDTDGVVAVSVTVTDLSGNTNTTTSITSGSVTIDTTAPTLSSGSSIGTTTDTTPTFTFTSSEAGIITSSLGFSTSNTAIASGNSITFNTLSNNTYSSQWVKVTDTAGNTSNQLTIPTFTVEANPYVSTDIQHLMWNQNPSGYTRGTVGFVQILAGPENSSGTGYDSTRPKTGWPLRVHHVNPANGTSYVVRPDGGIGLSTWNGTGLADRKKFKILKLAGGNYKITNVWQINNGVGSSFPQGHLNWVSEWDIEYNSTYNGNNVYNLKVVDPVSSTYTHANNSHINKYLTIATNTERDNQNDQWDTYRFQYAYDLFSARSDGYWLGQQWTFNFV